jgi:hypothetical protein
MKFLCDCEVGICSVICYATLWDLRISPRRRFQSWSSELWRESVQRCSRPCILATVDLYLHQMGIRANMAEEYHRTHLQSKCTPLEHIFPHLIISVGDKRCIWGEDHFQAFLNKVFKEIFGRKRDRYMRNMEYHKVLGGLYWSLLLLGSDIQEASKGWPCSSNGVNGEHIQNFCEGRRLVFLCCQIQTRWNKKLWEEFTMLTFFKCYTVRGKAART